MSKGTVASEAMHAMNETELERFMSKGTVASLIFSHA